jgi:hypothetical protein
MNGYRVQEHDPEWEPPTDVIRTPGRAAPPRRRSGAARALQGLSGSVTAGVVVLALVVVVTAWLGSRRGFPGPGAVSVTAHVVAAVLVVVAQRFADHRRGGVAAVGSLVVFFVTAVLLWTQWWG